MATAQPPKVLGSTAIKPVERKGFDKIKYFLYNPDNGEFLTRTPKSWALITLFYLVYYTALAGFWALMMTVFFTTIDYNRPTYIGRESVIGESPGLGLRPIQKEEFVDSSMIVFNVDNQEDVGHVQGWGGWVSRLDHFLDEYRNASLAREGGGRDCTREDPANEASGCKFDLGVLGRCGGGGYGYQAGHPCVFLKLNKIFGVKNEPYDNPDKVPGDMPAELADHIRSLPQDQRDQVWVDCHGEYPSDEEVLGDVAYFPATRGFPARYFPYMNQPDYVSPLVAVQFSPKAKGVLVHIECRAWAKNIGYSRRDRIGLVHLEVMVLDDAQAAQIEKDYHD